MRAPGNAVPVARQGENQNQQGDDDQSGGFERIEVRHLMMMRFRLQFAFRRGARHEDIVALNGC